MKTKVKPIKSSVIHIRIAESEKQRIQAEANKLNMNLSEYLLYLTRNKNIVVIEAGKELAQNVYELNKLLSNFEKYPIQSVSQLQDIVSQGIAKINNTIKECE